MIEGGGGGGGGSGGDYKDDGESLLSKLNPFKAVKKAQEQAAIEKRKQDANKVISEDMRIQLFGEGLMGRMVAGMINNVAGALKQQMSEAAEKSQDCYDAATRAVGNDSRVRRYLGDGVQCTPPMSQMSSSMNVNGVSTQTTQIGFMAQGNGRSAQVQATSSSGSDGSFKVDVTIALDNGEVFAVDTAAGGGAGGGVGGVEYEGAASGAVIDVESATIDVDPDDVKDAT